MKNIYEFNLLKGNGECVSMSQYKGKVLIIVNTATGCGFTPHYEVLEKIYEKYHEKGLEIIDIPCNQFLNQAPGTNEEITQFCKLHYKTQFEQMKKSDVNGDNELSLYTFLKSQKGFSGFNDSKGGKFMDEFLRKDDPNYDKNDDIKWNFTKFVVDQDGNVIKRFEPVDSMEEIENLISTLLN